MQWLSKSPLQDIFFSGKHNEIYALNFETLFETVSRHFLKTDSEDMWTYTLLYTALASSVIILSFLWMTDSPTKGKLRKWGIPQLHWLATDAWKGQHGRGPSHAVGSVAGGILEQGGKTT